MVHMYPNQPERNFYSILRAGLLVVLAANLLLADDVLTITGTATFSDLSGISAGDQWFGTLMTDGLCSVCTANGGGLLSLSINMYGDMFTAADVEGFPADPIFDRPSGGLTLTVSVGPFSDVISTVDLAHTFDLTRPELADVNGTYSVSGVPEPAGIVPLGTILVITVLTLRKKKPIGL
jgi:hypothetical protein